MKHRNVFHIAAVSLIEIMMIFTIIGIVTGACVSLNKPKNEYMLKIKLYSAFLALENAGKSIAAETHIDFTSDVNACETVRSSSPSICASYNSSSYPGANTQLPKVVARSTEDNVQVDPGLLTHTAYSSLSNARKQQFKYLQSGLCQRLARTFNVPDSGINCATTVDGATLISDATYPESFRSYTPQLYLPNGQVIYLNKFPFYEYRDSTGTFHQNRPRHDIYTFENKYVSANSTKCANLTTLFNALKSNTHNDDFSNSLNETRLAALKSYKTCSPADASNVNIQYWEKVWSKNKDFFLIYVDVNGKMTSTTDRANGPDRLNADVFAFRMYRDGTVLPDYRSGFPINSITAKMLIQSDSGSYQYDTSDYMLKPIVYSRCYANLTGTYSSGHPFDAIGICSTNGTKSPLNDCIDTNGNPLCKSVINKPSFFVR